MYYGSGTLLWDRSFPGGTILALAYSDDGSVIVCGRDDGTILAIDRDGALIFSGKAGSWVTSVGISGNGSTIAAATIDNQIQIYDRNGLLLGSYVSKNPVRFRSVAVSTDEALIVAVDPSNVFGFFRSHLNPATVTQTAVPTPDVTSELPQVTAISRNSTPGDAGVTPQSPVIPSTRAAGLLWLPGLAVIAIAVFVKKR